MNPSDFHDGPARFRRLPYTHRFGVLPPTAVDLPFCTDPLPQHAAPATPGDLLERFRFLIPTAAAFPFRPQGRLLQISDEATRRFACATACRFAPRKLTTLDHSNAASGR